MYRLLQYIEAQLHVYFTLPRFGGLPARFVDQKTIEIHKGTPQNLPHAYAIFHKHVFVIFFVIFHDINISPHVFVFFFVKNTFLKNGS